MTDYNPSADIAVGVPMFSREQALENFLESVPEYVTTAYIADNGDNKQREVYRRDYPFEVDISYLPHDCGIGQCRHTIASKCDADFLWMGDNDMEFLHELDLRKLQSILESNPGLGGVSGWLQEGDRIRSGSRQLINDGARLLKTVPESPVVQDEPLPHARFDFVPQCCLFRTAVFEEYTYDPTIYNSEHIDFFLGMRKTEWEFASTPSVLIKHNRDIDMEYRSSQRGQNHVDMDMIERKWGITDIQPGRRPDWMTTRNRGAKEQAFDVFRKVTPPKVWTPVRKFAAKVGLQ